MNELIKSTNDFLAVSLVIQAGILLMLFIGLDQILGILKEWKNPKL